MIELYVFTIKKSSYIVRMFKTHSIVWLLSVCPTRVLRPTPLPGYRRTGCFARIQFPSLNVAELRTEFRACLQKRSASRDSHVVVIASVAAIVVAVVAAVAAADKVAAAVVAAAAAATAAVAGGDAAAAAVAAAAAADVAAAAAAAVAALRCALVPGKGQAGTGR